MSYGILTLYDAFFQKDLHAVRHWQHLSRLQFGTKVQIYKLSSSRFIRHYWGNHVHFLFLHLLICLNSVGSLVSLHAKCNKSRNPLLAFNECCEAKLAARTIGWMLSESLVDFVQFMLSTRQWNKSQHWHATTHPVRSVAEAILADLGAFKRCRPEEDILPV